MVASDIKPGARLRHASTLDIDLVVREGQIFNLSYAIYFNTRYYNRHWKVFQAEPEQVRIMTDQLYLWEIINEET